MKLTYFQLAAHLAKQIAAVYLISGEDMVLKQDALQLIRKKAKQAEFNERTRFAPEKEGGLLYQLLHSSSLFAEKRLIELDFRDSPPSKIIADILQEYAKNPNADILLLIDMGKLDGKMTKQAWYQALDKIGYTIAIWPIPREQLPQWIQQRAQKYKLQFDHEAANLLADYAEGNLVAASQAIEKIYLLKPPSPVNAVLIETVLTDESHFSIFDFIENIIANNQDRYLHILEKLRADGIEPVLILWGITRELRLLIELAQQVKQGITYQAIFQKYKIFLRRQASIKAFLDQQMEHEIYQHLAQAFEIDKIIKGASPGNVWEAIQLFCLRLNANSHIIL